MNSNTNNKYKLLYELAPISYITINQDGLILEANKKATLLLNPNSKIEKENILKFIHRSLILEQT